MDRPVTIGNVHNMSLENFNEERPQLVAQLSCRTEAHYCIPVTAWIYHFGVRCASIWLYDVHNVTFKGVIVTVETLNVSGIILTNVCNVRIHLTTAYSSHDHYCLGIVIFESESVEVQSSSANNCTYEITLEYTANSHIRDITAMYNMWGMVLSNASNICISNTFVTQNALEGMLLGDTNNIHLNNTTATYNGVSGMHLLNMNNTYIINTTSIHNSESGMLLDTMEMLYCQHKCNTQQLGRNVLAQSEQCSHH